MIRRKSGQARAAEVFVRLRLDEAQSIGFEVKDREMLYFPS